MHKRYRRARPKRRRSKLKATNAGPILALTATVLGILGVIALLIFVAVPKLLPLIGMEVNFPWVPTPTPAPTIKPTPTPHPATVLDPMELQREVVLDSAAGSSEYAWFAEPCAYGDDLLFAGGHSVENNVVMDALFLLNMETGEQERLNLTLTNNQYVYPVINENWIVYLDAKTSAGGGGVIRAYHRADGTIKEVKTVYTGQPRLVLDGDRLAWTERTGSRMDKLFVCDLNTLESVAVQTFNNTPYGMSMPSMKNGQLLYASDDPNFITAEGAETSGIYYVSLSTGKSSVYTPGTYVHDPLTNGKQWIWRDGLHGEGNALYLSESGGAAKRIAENIIDFGIGDTFAAYSIDEAIYVYFFGNGKTHQITPDTSRELAQLVDVCGDVIIWMDVTTYGRDIMKYARIV